MSPKTLSIIVAKLERLDEYCRFLKQLARVRKSVFVEDFKIYGAAERFLQLSIEIILDVGRLTLAERGLTRPENNHEIFEILAKHKLVSQALYKRLLGVAGFRNILVHDYMKVDRNIVYDNLTTRLADFQSYKTAMIKSFRKGVLNAKERN